MSMLIHLPAGFNLTCQASASSRVVCANSQYHSIAFPRVKLAAVSS